MHRKFIALFLGSAMIVISLAASPVEARDRGETAAIIAGVTALAVVGATVASDRKHHGYVSRGHGYRTRHYAPRHRRGYYAPRHRGYRAHEYSGGRHGYRSHRSYGNRSHGYRGGYGYRTRSYYGH